MVKSSLVVSDIYRSIVLDKITMQYSINVDGGLVTISTLKQYFKIIISFRNSQKTHYLFLMTMKIFNFFLIWTQYQGQIYQEISYKFRP